MTTALIKCRTVHEVAITNRTAYSDQCQSYYW